MNEMHTLRAILLYAFFASVCLAVALGQAAELPSAPAPPQPAKPSQPVFSVPPGTPHTVVESTGSPPPGEVEEDDCYGPAEGIYAPQPKLSPPLQEALERYLFERHGRIYAAWLRNMPLSANDSWSKKAIVMVRFAIMPDGSIDTPIVTMSSGRKSYDAGAMKAVLGAVPFDPMPAGLTHPQPVCMVFGYKVDPRLKATKPPDPFATPAKPAP